MALGIVKTYLGSQFSANRRCLRSVCCSQLSWTWYFASSPKIALNLTLAQTLTLNLTLTQRKGKYNFASRGKIATLSFFQLLLATVCNSFQLMYAVYVRQYKAPNYY